MISIILQLDSIIAEEKSVNIRKENFVANFIE